MDALSTWSYGNPAAAYFFLLLPLFAFFAWWGWHQRQRDLKKLGQPHLRQESQEAQNLSRMRWRLAFLLLSSMWTILALMDPLEEISTRSEKAQNTSSTRINQEIWLLVDTSASMGVADEEGGETRLDVAKKTAQELLRLLPGRPIGVYTFTSRTDLLVPLTWDRLFVQLTMQNLSLDPQHPGGTDLAVLFDTINQARARHHYFANSALILLTDGGDTTWEIAKEEQQQKHLQQLRSKLPQEHAALFAVGFGSSKGGIVPNVSYQGQSVQSTLDSELLTSLITPSDRLFFSQKLSPYQIAKELKEALDRTLSYEIAEQDRPVTTIQQPRFALPLFFALLSLLALLAIPGIPTHRPALTEGD